MTIEYAVGPNVVSGAEILARIGHLCLVMG